MEQVSLSIINLRVNSEIARQLSQTHIDLNPDFQRAYESWTPKMKTRFIESMLLKRATNPIWTVHNPDNKSEDVLDGKHRLTTALKYLNNEFTLDNSLQTLDITKYIGKYFKDLSDDDQNNIRNYTFYINKLDSSYRDDEKLQEMFEILNSSSKPLNKHEIYKPLFKHFYKFLEQFSDQFYNTVLYPKTNSTRGEIETELTKILALSEEKLPTSFVSINDLYEKWQITNLGEHKEDIELALKNKSDTFKEIITRAKKYMDKFYEEELFTDKSKSMSIIYTAIITRCTAHIKNPAVFNRHMESLISQFRKDILVDNLQQILECSSRNAVFQKKLIEKIDIIIKNELGIKLEPRLFSKEDISKKLEEQNNICTLCQKEIKKSISKYEGDHIIPWAAGGKTEYSNLQVVHAKCHRVKK